MAWAWLNLRNKFVALITMQHWLQTGSQVSKFYYSLWHKEHNDQLSSKNIALHLQTLELFQAPSKQSNDHLFNFLRCYMNIFIIIKVSNFCTAQTHLKPLLQTSGTVTAHDMDRISWYCTFLNLVTKKVNFITSCHTTRIAIHTTNLQICSWWCL